MKSSILLISLLILSLSPTIGQNSDSLSFPYKSKSFNIQFGINQIKELDLLPLAHRGALTEFTYETENIKKSLRQFKFSIIYSRLKTSLEEMSKSGNIRLGFNYSYNFLVIKKNNLRYYIGPQTSLSYSFMMFPNFDDSHGYWADNFSFGPNNILSVSLKNKGEFFTSLSIPLISFFSRPDEVRPFKMDNSSFGGILKSLHSNIETGLLNKAMHINFRAEYRFPVFVTKREAVTFNMDIIRFSRKNEMPLLQIINRIGIKIML